MMGQLIHRSSREAFVGAKVLKEIAVAGQHALVLARVVLKRFNTELKQGGKRLRPGRSQRHCRPRLARPRA